MSGIFDQLIRKLADHDESKTQEIIENESYQT